MGSLSSKSHASSPTKCLSHFTRSGRRSSHCTACQDFEFKAVGSAHLDFALFAASTARLSLLVGTSRNGELNSG